jgi:hypothetical protein
MPALTDIRERSRADLKAKLHGDPRFGVAKECKDLMNELMDKMGVEAYCRWLARQSPPLDTLPAIEIRAALAARVEEEIR